MGTKPSTVYRTQPVVFPSSSHYIATVNKRFVKDRKVTLALDAQFWTQPRDHEYVIRDITTNQALFKIPPITEQDSTEPGRRRLLLDAYGVPVVGMERHDNPPRSAQYTVIPGGASSKAALCSFHTQMLGAYEPPLQLEFTDPASGKPMLLGAKGHWQSRDAVITITSDRRRNAAMYCIARIYYGEGGSPLDHTFLMDVAPGVDLSLVVLLAAAMEEQSKKYESNADRTTLRSAVEEAELRKRQQPPKQSSQQPKVKKLNVVGTATKASVA
jgi:hypothetical protein